MGELNKLLDVDRLLAEKLQKILKLPRATVLEESRCSTRTFGVPAEPGLMFSPQERYELLPGLIDVRLVEETVDYLGVCPVFGFCHAALEMFGHVVEEAVSGGKESGTDTAAPRALPLGVYDYILGMGACGAVVGRLVMLIESVRTPKYPVTAGAGVPAIPLVKFFLMALPVILACKGGLTRGAPVSGCRGRLAGLNSGGLGRRA